MTPTERSQTITERRHLPSGIREMLIELSPEEVVQRLQADGILAEIIKEEGMVKIRCEGRIYPVEKINPNPARGRIGVHKYKQ